MKQFNPKQRVRHKFGWHGTVVTGNERLSDGRILVQPDEDLRLWCLPQMLTAAEQHLETYHMVAISTEHLTQAEMDALGTLEPHNFPFLVAPFEQGAVVGCFNAEGLQAPEHGPYAEGRWPNLHQVRLWAHRQGFRYVMLDRDAGCVAALRAFDW